MFYMHLQYCCVVLYVKLSHKHGHMHRDMTAFLTDWSIESSVTLRGIGVARPIDQITDL